MSIACVAVIGKNNNPLYLRSFANLDDQLKFHYVVHTSLDMVEERVNLKKASNATAILDMYLGMLYPTEDFKVYGYITNTKIKLIVVIDDSYTEIKENELRSFFRQFHSIFTEMVMNPFYIPDEKIDSRKFDRKVTTLVSGFSK